MAKLNVESKKNNDWWKWLVGIIAAIIIIWLIIEFTGNDDDVIDKSEPISSIEFNTLSVNPVTVSYG